MSIRKKYPKIKPEFIKDAQNKIVLVYLNLNEYESIIDEIKELRYSLGFEKKSKVKSSKKSK